MASISADDKTWKATPMTCSPQPVTSPEKKPIPLRNDSSEPTKGSDSVFYLAYGSNMQDETFLGRRGIRPLSQVNVLVPGVTMTFDMAAIPYLEPCVAGAQFTSDLDAAAAGREADANAVDLEKAPLLDGYSSSSSHWSSSAPRWTKPMVGVVYELTPKDYERVIVTEDTRYRVVEVDCHPFPESYRPEDPTPEKLDTRAFKARTLMSPPRDDPFMRPDPNYAQPSLRYLTLLRTGAAQRNLPLDYRAYLDSLHEYHITTWRQQVGRAIYLITFLPLLLFLAFLKLYLLDRLGSSPVLLDKLQEGTFKGMWLAYDGLFQRLCGDGERTIEESDTVLSKN